MPPITLDPLSAGASMFGGVLSYLGGQQANRQNVQLQRETNALNYKMMLENQGFQREMFNKQLNAQDPAFLRQRLEDAGYNPASLVAGANGMLGTAPSVSPTPPIAAQSPQVRDAVTPAVQVAASGLSASADAIHKIEQAKGQAIDNSFKVENWNAAIEKLKADKIISDQQAQALEWQNLLTSMNFDALSKTANQQLYKIDAEARLADAQAKLQDWLRNTKGPKEIEEINARIKNLASQAKYFDAQEYATRKQVPVTISSLLMKAYRDLQEGQNIEQERELREPVKKRLTELMNGDDWKSSGAQLLYLILTGGNVNH